MGEMNGRIDRSGLKVDANLASFIDNDVLGPLGLDLGAFWQGFAALVGHFAPVETGRDDHVLARVQNGRNRPAHTAAGSRDAGVKDGAQFGPLSVPGHSGAIRRCRHPRPGRPYCGVSEPRMSAQKRLALPVKDAFLGVWLSPSEAASS